MFRRCSSVLFLLLIAPGCIAQTVHSLALRGTIVTPANIVSDGVVTVAGNRIEDVRAAQEGSEKGIDTGSFIFPGLIDLHDHITWNVFPRWKPNQVFRNRYEWQQTDVYKAVLDGPHAKLAANHGLLCDAERFGEIKAIVNGGTSIVGSLEPTPNTDDNACVEGLARNLDVYSGFDGSVLNHEKVLYEVFPFEMKLTDAATVRPRLDSGNLKAFLVHVGEGNASDAAAAREFRMFAKRGDGFLHAGVSIIHGAALHPADFKLMAAAGVGLIWSPRSNFELYGATADVRSAKAAGVTIAIAPDWSPTGSDGMIEELEYASQWNAAQTPPVFSDAELAQMATAIPAKLAGAADEIGSIDKGMYADLLLIKKTGSDPYRALTHASAADVQLVMIGGEPVYGDADLMKALLPGKHVEAMTVCGAAKAIYIEPQKGIADTQKSYQQISQELGAKLSELGTSLSELAPCGKDGNQ